MRGRAVNDHRELFEVCCDLMAAVSAEGRGLPAYALGALGHLAACRGSPDRGIRAR